MRHKTPGMSKATKERLPAYCRCLRQLLIEGRYRISSEELAKRMGLSGAQVRVDIHRFDCSGVSGYGFGVKPLYTEIAALLGIGEGYAAVSIGNETRVTDILESGPFGRYGVRVLAYMAESEEDSVLREKIQALSPAIGVIEVVCRKPQRIAELLIESGVRGILNLTDIMLPETAGVSIQNCPLSDDMMLLCGRMKKQGEKEQ